MIKFKIIKNKSKNKASQDDKFIIDDVEVHVRNITKTTIYFTDDTFYPCKVFNRWFRLELHMKNVEKTLLLKSYYHKIKIQKQIDSLPSVCSKEPINSLRFIILREFNDNKFHWAFGNSATSHSKLESEFKKLNSQISCDCIAGGFYNFVIGNAREIINPSKEMEFRYLTGVNSELKDTLFLFGKSDTYGLDKKILQEAIPTLFEKNILHKNVEIKII